MRAYPSSVDLSTPEGLERVVRQIFDMIYSISYNVVEPGITDSQLALIKKELQVNGKYPLNIKGLPS
jgi:hypothetical protein